MSTSAVRKIIPLEQTQSSIHNIKPQKTPHLRVVPTGQSGISSPPEPIEGPHLYHNQEEEVSEQIPAGFNVRAMALVLDGIFCGIVFKVLNLLLKGFYIYLQQNNSGLYTLVSIVVALLVTSYYYAWPLSEFGQTLGKKLMGIKIIDANTNRNIGFFQALGRETMGRIISSLLLFGGYLCVIFRHDKRALHDILFKTTVIKVK